MSGGRVRLLSGTAPETPPAGYCEIFVDSADKHAKQINDAGVISDLVTAQTFSFRTITASGPITVNDTFVVFDSAVALAITLPDIASLSMTVLVKNIGTGNVTITPFGSQTIDGQLSLALNKKFQAVQLVAIAGEWHLW
jgi:hypothetical protein